MSDKIEQLISSLREVLESGKNISVAEVPFINFAGDVPNKGLIWSGDGNNKQFIFVNDPDRFFVSEHLDLARGRNYSINGVGVLSETELGPTVTKSNIREIGRLRKLNVDGDVVFNQYLFYDANSDRLGLGTDQPKAALSIADMNIELMFGASEPNVGAIGTFNSADLEFVTDSTGRLTVKANGDIVLGNHANGPINVSVVGSLGVDTDHIDPRAKLHVNGPINFNNKVHLSGTEPPETGSFNQGDIVWNSDPAPGKFVGWVYVKAGTWNGFGKIE